MRGFATKGEPDRQSLFSIGMLLQIHACHRSRRINKEAFTKRVDDGMKGWVNDVWGEWNFFGTAGRLTDDLLEKMEAHVSKHVAKRKRHVVSEDEDEGTRKKKVAAGKM